MPHDIHSVVPSSEPLQPEDFDALDAILDDVRERREGGPQWEFCEGFMAALICCRRLIMPSEYFPELFDLEEGESLGFADEGQAARFMELWHRRWNEVAAALNNDEVDSLEDEACYHPEVLDVRSMVAALPESARADIEGEELPSFGQVWALGFMYAVECWPEEWALPRDKEDARAIDEALARIAALAEADEGEPVLSPLTEDGPPTVSQQRIEDFGAAIWAVYELRETWRAIGPRVETVRREATPGRNDPCFCGSGRKYKKCHGAG